jgi:malate dehydrogenase (oxaloacetate-decarboxylating)
MDRKEAERQAAFQILQRSYLGAGKLEVLPKVFPNDLSDVAALYTPGVGYLVRAILERDDALGELTGRNNSVAVVTDGTAVLGFGAVGPRAALPVMEGKASMFKLLVGIDATPICAATRNPDELVALLRQLEPTFGGFNLEDVASPWCFEVMRRATQELNVPIIHDDQYGTATVVIAGLSNALKLLGRDASRQTVVVCGDGAAGTATTRLLLASGFGDIRVVGLQGILIDGTSYQEPHKNDLARLTNRARVRGGLAEAMRGADIFVGLSTGGIVNADLVRSMNRDPIVFAMANPVPEIMPEESLAAGASIVATGRFDYPNQCNNVLAFPGLMRGALDTAATEVSEAVCLAAAQTIAADIPDQMLAADNILPTPLSDSLYASVAESVATTIVELGLARRIPARGEVFESTQRCRRAVSWRLKQLMEDHFPG